MRAWLMLGVLALAAPRVTGQHLRVTTDKRSYAYGEPIRVFVTVVNPTDSTFGFSTPCTGNPFSGRGWVGFDDIRSWDNAGACLAALQSYSVPPRSEIVWTRVVQPSRTGLPGTNGLHVVHASLFAYRHADGQAFTFTAQNTVDAPQYLGGQVNVRFLARDSSRVRTVRLQLGAALVESVTRPVLLAETDESWRLSGALVDSTVARLLRDPLFTWAYASRVIEAEPTRVLTAIEEPRPHASALSEPTPHPFRAQAAFRFVPDVPGPVRAEAFDALGRRVAVLYEGPAAAGEALTLTLDGTALRPGLYLVRVTTAAGVWTRTVIRSGG